MQQALVNWEQRVLTVILEVIIVKIILTILKQLFTFIFPLTLSRCIELTKL